MFAYCGNSSVNAQDLTGTWTVGITFSFGTAIFMVFMGGWASVSLVWDDKGNFDTQYSYSLIGVNDTATVGLIEVHANGGIQITKADTVYDLYGISSSVGGGGSNYGGELQSFEPLREADTVDGVQFTAGVDPNVGFDIHESNSYTGHLDLAGIGVSPKGRMMSAPAGSNLVKKITEKNKPIWNTKSRCHKKQAVIWQP